MLLVYIPLVLASLTQLSDGHKYSRKKCPYPRAVADFDQSRILGKWKVEYAVRTTSTCLVFDFRQEGSRFKVYETKELAVPEKVGVELKYGSVGTLSPTAESGYYQVSYSTSAISGRFIMLDTDYQAFLVILHCQQLSFMGSRRSLYVLSRGNSTISEGRLNKVKARMSEVDLEPGLLAQVSHTGCVAREDADIDLTGPVNLKDVLRAAKKVVSVGGSVAQFIEVLSMIGN